MAQMQLRKLLATYSAALTAGCVLYLVLINDRLHLRHTVSLC